MSWLSRLGQGLGLRPRQAWVDDRGKSARLATGDVGGWSWGRESGAGKTVNVNSALQLATAWACIRLTAQAIATMGAGIYRKNADGSREGLTDHDLAALLQDSPNEDQTPFEFWEVMVAAMCATGNAYAEKVHTGSRLTSVEPLLNCRPVRLEDRRLVYRVVDRGQSEDLPREKVFHLRGFSLGGDLGLSPIACGAEGLGAAMAAEETTAAMFANGLQQPLFIDSGQTRLSPEQRADLTALFRKFQGSSNAAKVMVLEAGMTPKPLTLNPDDAQMLETRRFQIEEMCRWWGVPPIIVGHAAEGQTMWGTGVESILLTWLALGINPLARRIEARIRKQLLGPEDRRTVYAEFNREALLQMDSKAKAEFLSAVTQNGLMTRHEGRAKLNLPRVDQPGADLLTAQSNLAPLDLLGRAAGGKP